MVNTSEPEISSLLESLYEKYGYDFRQYSRAHIERRIRNRMMVSGLSSVAEVQYKVLHNSGFASQLLQDLSITVTEMFRDPHFYKYLRENVVPFLKTYSFLKIWHAGCSTGEEVYSLAIVLMESGIYDRATIYATDFNQLALDSAREGIYPGNKIKEYSLNYQRSGGAGSLAEHYLSRHDMVIMDKSLKKNIVWANHNLVTDSIFAEVHLILCRNVLIYFNRDLQNKVQTLFYESLVNGGILCLGSKESLRFSSFADKYNEMDKAQKVFKKKYR